MGFLTGLFSTPMMGLLTQGVGVGMSAAAAKQQAEADNLTRQWNATIAKQEADLALIQAENARTRGGIAAAETRLEYDKLRGSQRAAYGASGVDANWGSAAAVQADTMAWGEYAAQKELYNYGMEAWGHEQSARFKEMEAQAYLSGASNSALAGATSAISGLTNMFNTYGTWKK